MKYGRKLKKFNIDKKFSEILINRSNGINEKAIFKIISKSKNQEDFEDNIKIYLKSTDRNIYASVLLVGNITGKYVFNDF